MKIFLPPLDTRWRFLADWTPTKSFLDASHNDETLWGQPSYQFDAFSKATGIQTTGHGGEWVEPYHKWVQAQRDARGFDGILLAGTILQIERYHISRSGEDLVTTKVMLSPSKFLTPKKQGGVMRGAGRLYFNLEQFNTLPDLEPVTENLS